MDQLLKERIEENKKLFTEYELKIIYNNDILIKKIYELGIFDTEWAKRWAK